MKPILQNPVRFSEASINVWCSPLLPDNDVRRGDCTMENCANGIGLTLLRPAYDRLGTKSCLACVLYRSHVQHLTGVHYTVKVVRASNMAVPSRVFVDFPNLCVGPLGKKPKINQNYAAARKYRHTLLQYTSPYTSEDTYIAD
jgi:hypothetical protein